MLAASPQEDLSMPLIEEEIDGLSGLLFPFYDADTHMLYLAGKVVEGGEGLGSLWETPPRMWPPLLPDFPQKNQPHLSGLPLCQPGSFLLFFH